MTDYNKPLPRPNVTSQPFWQAAKKHELKLQRCKSCGAYIYYPRTLCPQDLSSDLEWVTVSGKGTVYSYTIAETPTHPAFTGDVPYTIAIVELAEGPRMTTNIVGCQPSEVKVGMPVKVCFDDVTPEMTLVKFQPE
jgi:uncharacterized protein